MNVAMTAWWAALTLWACFIALGAFIHSAVRRDNSLLGVAFGCAAIAATELAVTLMFAFGEWS